MNKNGTQKLKEIIIRDKETKKDNRRFTTDNHQHKESGELRGVGWGRGCKGLYITEKL